MPGEVTVKIGDVDIWKYTFHEPINSYLLVMSLRRNITRANSGTDKEGIW